MKARIREERGSNLIEVALLIPLLFSLLIGVVDFGRAYHTYITMINAAREGARYAVDQPDDVSTIANIVRQEAQSSNVDLSAAVINVDNQGPGNPVTVTVQMNFPTILGGIIGFNNIPLQVSATFRVR